MSDLDRHREAAARFRANMARDQTLMRRAGQPTSATFATEVLSAEEGHLQLRFEVGETFGNFFGGVQGGVLGALLDEACSYAIISSVGVHCFLGTLEQHLRIFKRAPLGTLLATAKVSSLSRHAAHTEAELFCKDERVAAGTAIALLDVTRPIREDWVVKV